jgi:hypothetical protein
VTQRSAPSEEIEIEIGLDEPDDDQSLRVLAARKLHVAQEALEELTVVRRALDARHGRVRFHLTLARKAEHREALAPPEPRDVAPRPRVVIVGDGPCGLFCAYELARAGVASLVLDRGKPVQPRRHDLKGLLQDGRLDPESNYCFGEGGAGTYSDGKLYTRAHKRGDVRDVIEILARHGAPTSILTDARPHIGSNKLPKVISALRQHLESVGVAFEFGAQVVGIARGSRGVVQGVKLHDGREVFADAVVLCTGHSARDVLVWLDAAGVKLEPKGFAVGVRIEHPQPLIDRIQYGAHAGHARLPSAAYRLAHTEDERGVFSFCMCPGGFIVPAATEPDGIVLNGMSLSKRSSRFANSGLVVSIEQDDLAHAGLRGPLAGIELQRRIERAAKLAGGGGLRAPATRATDFLRGHASSTLPISSYEPGLTAADVSEVLAASGLPLATRIRRALSVFGERMHGYVTEDAVLAGVESRTSSPVRIPRDPETLQCVGLQGLYPAGEGAGYAGGIVSAAMDGMRVARSLARTLAPEATQGR